MGGDGLGTRGSVAVSCWLGTRGSVPVSCWVGFGRGWVVPEGMG
jgi:hypothetical protein